jgi:hypothetical protein
VHVNNVIPAWLGRELLKGKNGNKSYVFISGEATPKGAVSTFDKMYRRVFKAAGIAGTSHMFRHTFSVELLKAGVDIRKVSKALGRHHHRAVLCEVEQSPTGHLRRGLGHRLGQAVATDSDGTGTAEDTLTRLFGWLARKRHGDGQAISQLPPSGKRLLRPPRKMKFSPKRQAGE